MARAVKYCKRCKSNRPSEATSGAVKELARIGFNMTSKIKLTALLLSLLSASACAPLLVGGAAAVVADEVVEQDKGGDGLF